jgi:hypothetical protein
MPGRQPNTCTQRPLSGGLNFGERQHVWNRYSGLPEGAKYAAAQNNYFQVPGEASFVRLVIFLLKLFSALSYTQVTARSARQQSDASAELELANAVKLSILGIMIGSVSLSLAYYDMFLTFYALTYSVRRIRSSPSNMR